MGGNDGLYHLVGLAHAPIVRTERFVEHFIISKWLNAMLSIHTNHSLGSKYNGQDVMCNNVLGHMCVKQRNILTEKFITVEIALF
jgi:hypothetical protein